jgi:diguanylate cyclase (GGDEF)-like protein/PAS domain S-box-containing protein
VVTPSLTQRLGLAPVDLGRAEQRALLAARSACVLFSIQSVLALAAASIGGTLGAGVVGAAVLTFCMALVVFCAYERLPWVVSQLLALGGVVVAAFLVVHQPHGERYALLFVAPVIYVSFFFKRRNALANLALVSLLCGAALALALPSGGAAETWVLVVGALAQAAGTTIALRRHLLRAFERSRAHRAALDAFFHNAPGGYAFLDGDLRFVRVNQMLAGLLGLPAEQIVGKSVREVTPDQADRTELLMRQVIEEGVHMSGIEFSSADSGSHFLVSYYPVAGPDGAAGVGIALTDVTHLKDVEKRLGESNQRLTVLATTDELTGLPNRRMLSEQLDLALARARRGGLAVAVLCLDLDRFKDINDSLGHAVGDDLLIEVASRLRAGARETDVVARYGGDEFVIVLADLDVQAARDHAVTVVERLRGLLADPYAIGPVELNTAASIGVAVYPFDSRDAKGLLAAADAEMYSGKSAVSRVA